MHMVHVQDLSTSNGVCRIPYVWALFPVCSVLEDSIPRVDLAGVLCYADKASTEDKVKNILDDESMAIKNSSIWSPSRPISLESK